LQASAQKSSAHRRRDGKEIKDRQAQVSYLKNGATFTKRASPDDQRMDKLDVYLDAIQRSKPPDQTRSGWDYDSAVKARKSRSDFAANVMKEI